MVQNFMHKPSISPTPWIITIPIVHHDVRAAGKRCASFFTLLNTTPRGSIARSSKIFKNTWFFHAPLIVANAPMILVLTAIVTGIPKLDYLLLLARPCDLRCYQLSRLRLARVAVGNRLITLLLEVLDLEKHM